MSFSSATLRSLSSFRQLIVVVTLAFAAIFTSLGATPASAQSFQFSAISVQGNVRIESGTILNYLAIGTGEAVSAAQLNDAAQRIRGSGLFETVDIIPQGGTLIIQVVEFPTINRINFEGNSRLDDAELASVISSRERFVYNPAQAEQDAAALAAHYAAVGRVNATVTPSIIRRSDNRVDLVFAVFEGGVTEVERIGFVGNRSFSDRRLRGVLETKQAGLLRVLIQRDTYSPDRVEFDKAVLTDFYHSRGYIDFEIQSVDVVLTRQRDAHLVTFNVTEGQQFHFANVSVISEIDGVDIGPYASAVRLKTGDVYSPTTIDNEITRLEVMAERAGLRFVHVEPRITRNERDLTLDITFALVTGERIFVERIDIEGNNTTLDRVVRNQFRVVEGDPLNPRSIRESAERIKALGYFADAQVNVVPGSSPDTVVVDVNVVEAPTGSLSFGANYSSDVGFGLVGSFRERNFLGRGQTLNLEISTAETNRNFSLDFAEPNFLGRDLRFGLNLSYLLTDNQSASYDTETFRFSPSFTFSLAERSTLALFYGLKYSDITDVTSTSAFIVADGALEGLWTSSVGYTYSFDTRRGAVNPGTGVLLRFGQEVGFGDSEFLKTTAMAVAETKIMNDDVTLRATLEGGLLTYASGASLITDRFFMGSRVMRGFDPAGIGPRDSTTLEALGGNAYAVARLEAEFPIGLPEEYGISGGVFFDYGSLWDVGTGSDIGILYNDFTPRAVAGLSLFWDTPVGPLRFNFSEPLDVQPEDQTSSFDITVSTRF